jgi:hypothetical protein
MSDSRSWYFPLYAARSAVPMAPAAPVINTRFIFPPPLKLDSLSHVQRGNHSVIARVGTDLWFSLAAGNWSKSGANQAVLPDWIPPSTCARGARFFTPFLQATVYCSIRIFCHLLARLASTATWAATTMNDALKISFPPFTDEQSLRSAIESVCAGFGSVKSLRILPAARDEALQCACLLRLDSPAAERALKARLYVGEFHPDIVFMADVDEAWAGPRMV